MRRFVLVTLVLVSSVAGLAQEHKPCSETLQKESTLTAREQWCWYKDQRISVVPIMTAAGIAGVDRWRNHPRPWGQGGEAYAKRFGSSYGAGFTQDTAELFTGMALNQDPRYITLHSGSFGRRFIHAIGYTLVARSGRGHNEFAVNRLAGATAGGFIPNAWYPDGYNRPIDGATRVGFALVGYGVSSLLAEFSPELKKLNPFHRRK